MSLYTPYLEEKPANILERCGFHIYRYHRELYFEVHAFLQTLEIRSKKWVSLHVFKKFSNIDYRLESVNAILFVISVHRGFDVEVKHCLRDGDEQVYGHVCKRVSSLIVNVAARCVAYLIVIIDIKALNVDDGNYWPQKGAHQKN